MVVADWIGRAARVARGKGLQGSKSRADFPVVRGMGQYDQLDVSALACFEVLARRVALLEECYTANPKNPRFEGTEHFSGLGRKTAAVAPDLSKHVATALQAESQIAKERRKAREEASLAAGSKK